MRTTRRLLVLMLASLIGTGAHAGEDETTARLDASHEMVDTLLRRSKALEDQIAPGSGYQTEDEARQRYEDYVYLHLIGEHSQAAEGFFALVTSGALGESSMHRDAEWYLADSLYQLGNLSTAEARFQTIVDQPGHPFRDDAVRQILEIYAVTDRTDDFTRLYEEEILRGNVEATDEVLYSLGKSFYKRGEIGEARARFERVGTESDHYGRARYFLGVLATVERDLPGALLHFKEAADQSVDTADDRTVHDLALLAGGRVLFEQGLYADAAATYDLIGGDSEFRSDQLYELVWTQIKQEEWDRALELVEIFLIAFPEHAYAAQLKLVEGHLNVSRQEFDRALVAYENVLAEYGPIRDYFASLQEAEDPAIYLKQFTGEEGFTTLRLPDFAVSKMLEDPDLARAVGILTELRQQEEDLARSEELIRELAPILAVGQGLGGFEQMRYDAVLVASQAAEQSLLLLEVEEEWLFDNLPNNQHRDVRPLQDRRLALIGQARDSEYQLQAAREALERHKLAVGRVRRDTADTIATASRYLGLILEIRGLLEDPNVKVKGKMREIVEEDLDYLENELVESSKELELLDQELAALRAPSDSQRLVYAARPVGNLLEEIEALRHDYADLRPGNRVAPASERIDGLHHSLNAIHARLQTVSAGLGEVERNEMEVLRARFETVVAEVNSERAQLASNLEATRGVSSDLTREGFGRLAGFFTESLLKADTGIVDVYWSQKLATVDEIARVKDEKAALLDELERRFELIEQKLAR